MTTASAVPQTTADIATEPKATAVIYLRVSSDGQVNKAHNPEGYSIPAQREACERHAMSLGARVVGEYVEAGYSGTTLRRPALQSMLGQLAEIKPNYVVFYDLSRVAREESDAFWLLSEIRRHGAKLESTVERIDDSPQGLLLFAVMAGVNAFRSRGDAEKVKLGMSRKHADGGTVGKVPIGYLNTIERVEGREVRSVDLDPERAPLVKLAFDAFATGEYSISELRDLLDEAGLRTPMTAKRAPAALSRANVHYMLRRDYYVGVVTWRGAKNPNGRHPALIDDETFARVQEILTAHAHSGDRTHKHGHYLKGSIYCGYCGRRLIFSRVRGRTGEHYEYFGCSSRPGRGEHCEGHHHRVDRVEKAVERYYAGIRLTQSERRLIRSEVERYVSGLMEGAEKESKRHAERLLDLQRQQQKLLHLHYADKVDEDVFVADQERIKRERAEAQRWADAAELDGREITQALDEALALLTDTRCFYEAASPHTRRLLNQAIFRRLVILDDWVSAAEETPWVAAMRGLARAASRPATAKPASQTARRGRAAGPAPAVLRDVLNDTKLVRPSGLEPPRTKWSTRPSTLRVYQFRHRRRVGEYSPAGVPESVAGMQRRVRDARRGLHPSTADATVRTSVRLRPQYTRTGSRADMDLTKRQQEIFDFIRKYSAKYGYPPTVRDIGKAVGLASSSTVHAHLANLEKLGLLRRDPSKPRAIELLDRAVGNAVDTVRGMVRMDGLPLLGSVAAGQPMLAEENIEDYVSVPEIAGGGDGEYLLRIRGDSMKEAGIIEGDFVVVRPQDTARDGDVVVALLGEEATVKRFFRETDHIRLQPENATMEPIRSKEVTVLGRVVGLLRSV